MTMLLFTGPMYAPSGFCNVPSTDSSPAVNESKDSVQMDPSIVTGTDELNNPTINFTSEKTFKIRRVKLCLKR